MARRFFWIVIAVSSVFSQESYSVADNYFGDFLQSGGYEKLLSNRIAYPGLFADSARRAGGGYHYYSWKGLYAWDEWNAGKNRIGGWIGNTTLNFVEDENDVPGSSGLGRRLESEYRGSGSLWFIPAGHSSLQGVSLYCTGDRSFHTNRCIGEKETVVDSSVDADFSCIASALLKTSTSNLVKLSVFNRWVGKRNDIRQEYPEGQIGFPFYESYLQTFHSLTFSADFIMKKRTIIGAGVRMESQEWDYDGAEGWYSTNSYAGEGAFFISASTGKSFRYNRHAAHVLFRASSDFSFPCTSFAPVGFDELIKSTRRDTRSIMVKVDAPALVEIGLFSWPAAVFARIDPEIYFFHETRPTQKTRRILPFFGTSSLGLKGTVGERLEFALVPSTRSSVFITALDIRYSIPGK